jgi:hypothetical protein
MRFSPNHPAATAPDALIKPGLDLLRDKNDRVEGTITDTDTDRTVDFGGGFGRRRR